MVFSFYLCINVDKSFFMSLFRDAGYVILLYTCCANMIYRIPRDSGLVSYAKRQRVIFIFIDTIVFITTHIFSTYKTYITCIDEF